jgi:hypothetical protein
MARRIVNHGGAWKVCRAKRGQRGLFLFRFQTHPDILGIPKSRKVYDLQLWDARIASRSINENCCLRNSTN